jgi:hypothetical protein
MDQCAICKHRVAPGMVFCKDHYAEYQDEVGKPWFSAWKLEGQKERRYRIKNIEKLVSLEYLQEIMLTREERKIRG